MKIHIITLFPDMFEPVLNTSMLLKAQKLKLVEYKIVNLRGFGIGKHKTVDDVPYGGGAGMVLKPEPVFKAVEMIKKTDKHSKVVMMSPRGKQYTQRLANTLSKEEGLIILCGHYEGFDERIYDIIDYEISIGDYVLTGGEIPAMVVTDSVTRLIPGVLGDDQSNKDESFSSGILEYPQYTRPEMYKGKKVPEVLRSGDHAAISKWRKENALIKTKSNRPDLIDF